MESRPTGQPSDATQTNIYGFILLSKNRGFTTIRFVF